MMRQYIYAAVILLLGIATVWVVIHVLTTGGGEVGSAYSSPPGRYDAFFITYFSGIVMPPHFPETRNAQGPFPSFSPGTYEETRELLGVKFRIGIYARENKKFEKSMARSAVDDAFRRIAEIEEHTSLTREDSEVSKINREAFSRPVPLSEDLYFVVKRSLDVSERSSGAFDITSGPIRWLWETYGSQGEVPPAEKIQEARALVGYRDIVLDSKKLTIRFKKKGMTIDLHDVVCGFALDQAAWILKRQGMTPAFIQADDHYLLLDHPEGVPYIIGIPDGRGFLKYTFDVDRPAVVIKGAYKGTRVLGTTVLSDIVDPRNGTCVGMVASCTVVGPDAMTSDALATALCVMGGSKAINFVNSFNPKE
jgi:thiamine biosynthesis lipoprotein